MKKDIRANVFAALLTVAGMLFCCTSPVSAATVTVTLDGNGSGSVNSNPSGMIYCSYPPLSGTCSSLQSATNPVTLTATPSGNSAFSRWGGSCSACPGNSCQLTLESDKTCSATFTTLPPLRISGNMPAYYWNIQEAFDAATGGATIEAQAGSIAGNLLPINPGRITFKGGYDGTYTNQSGFSTLKGNLTVRSATVVANRLHISAPPASAPAAPAQPAALPGNAEVFLTWTRVNNAASYVVYYSNTPGVTTASTKSGVITAASYTVTPLTNGTPWYFRVAAVNSRGEGPLSPEQTATPFNQPPSAPTGLTVTPGNTELILQWTPVPGATAYKLYISDTPGVTKATGFALGEAPNPCTVTELDNGIRYYFVVTAVNGSGESAESNEASGIPTAPTSPLVGAWGDLHVSGISYYNTSTHSWANPSGSGSRIEFYADGTFTNSFYYQSPPSCSYTFFLWTTGTYTVNGAELTFAETEHYKKETYACDPSANNDGPITPVTKIYKWDILGIAGPPADKKLYLDDLSSPAVEWIQYPWIP